MLLQDAVTVRSIRGRVDDVLILKALLEIVQSSLLIIHIEDVIGAGLFLAHAGV
jgi:hypothetical protein